MMKKDTLVLRRTLLAVLVGAALAGCELETISDETNDAGKGKPEIPSVEFDGMTAADGKAIIYYIRKDGDYSDWGLHLWNEDCSALDGPMITEWAEPMTATGVDSYGAYFEIDLQSNADLANGCFNFIVRKSDGSLKDIGGGDNKLHFADFPDRQVFLHSGNATFFDDYVAEPPVGMEGAKAHWLSKDTLVWEDGAEADSVELHFSESAGIVYDAENKKISGSQKLVLASGYFSDELKAKFPHLKDIGVLEIKATDEALKDILKGQLIAVARDADGAIVAVTKVQIPGVLDDLYGTEAADKQLGAIADIDSNSVEFALWAPTAQRVNLVAYDEDKALKPGFPQEMQFDADTGIWHHDGADVAHYDFYRYEVSVYHPASDRIETYEVTDPYSLSLASNSRYSQVVDLKDPELAPPGWGEDETKYKWTQQPEDMVIYESHIRDFSASDDTVSVEYQGKYKAFTETDTDGFMHLKDLQAAGLTHFHLLPAFDIATVKEDVAPVNIDSTVGELCAANSSAAVCATESESAVIRDVLAGYDPMTGDAQALVGDLRMLDSFNWGYDPYHYTVPEGSYATDAEGVTRIYEFREMVQSLQDNGLGVIMDVVYNHTNASGLGEKSVLDKIVPGYYHRLNIDSGTVEKSTCCENTASENVMMEKLMIDSLVTWADQYQINGFRFDLMGHHMKSNMIKALAAVQAVDKNTYFYGEGWNFGEVADGARGENAIQPYMAGTGIGTFTDRLRDAVRGGSPFDDGEGIRKSQGFANGLGVANLNNELVEDDTAEYLLSADQIRIGMAGNLSDFVIIDGSGNGARGDGVDYNGAPTGYAADPQEIINYVSKHDNQTLWDNNQYKIATEVTIGDRARMQVLGLSFPLLSQGIPFIHMGSELLRSKSMERDSYDSGDWFNAVNWDMSNNNWNVGLPRENVDGANWEVIKTILGNGHTAATTTEIMDTRDAFLSLLKVRSDLPLLRLQKAADIKARVDFHNTGPDQARGLIAMSIDDGAGLPDLDTSVDAVMVVINASDEAKAIEVEGAADFVLHEALVDYAAGADFADGEFTVPALTAAVFVKPQGVQQGTGIKVVNKRIGEQPPFADQPVTLRGFAGSASLEREMEFVGNATYAVTLEELAAEASVEFDVMGDVLYGHADVEIAQGSLELLSNDLGNLVFTVPHEGDYIVSIAVPTAGKPVVSVTSAEKPDLPAPFGAETAYLRGAMNGWGTDDALTYVSHGIYSIARELDAGNYDFKFGDGSWGVFSLGAGSTGGDIVYGEPLVLTNDAGSGNLKLADAEAGLYQFKLDTTDTSAPVVTVSKDALPYDVELMLRGDMNGWANDAADAAEAGFTYVGGGNYVISVEITAGTYGFKIADSGWSTEFGQGDSGADIGVGELKAIGNGGNLSVTIPADGTYRFILNVSDKEAPSVYVTGL